MSKFERNEKPIRGGGGCFFFAPVGYECSNRLWVSGHGKSCLLHLFLSTCIQLSIKQYMPNFCRRYSCKYYVYTCKYIVLIWCIIFVYVKIKYNNNFCITANRCLQIFSFVFVLFFGFHSSLNLKSEQVRQNFLERKCLQFKYKISYSFKV